jgi:uncharacterized repeat protein (TIGR01451 family)
LVTSAALGVALLLGACGGGSGRSGTDLAVSGTGPTAQLNGGDPAVFVMTVSNVGGFDASNVTIRNATSQISQSSISITCTGTGGATCPTTTGSTMSVPTLPSGGSLTFKVNGNTNLGASGNFSDTMSVSSDTTDDNGNNNTATVIDTVVSNDVSVTATAPAGPLLSGPATFTMVVSNAGPDSATNVVLATTVSANLTPFSSSGITCVANPNTGSSASPTASVPKLQADGTLVSALIPAAGSLTCSVPVTVVDATNGTATVSMTATAVGDSHAGNNTGTAQVSATLVSDLNVTAGTSPGTVSGGATTSVSFVIGNAGPATASDVTITDTLTSNLKAAGPIACVPALGAVAPVVQSNGALVSSSIPLGATLTCSVPVTVTAGTNDNESVTLAVSTVSDSHTADNSAKVTINAVSSDLGVSQTTSPTQVGAGTQATFTATIANPGSQGVASNLSIQWTHTQPSGVTFELPTCTAAPSGTTCPSIASGSTTWSVPTLAPGARLVFTFVADTTTAARGAVVNTVTIKSDGDPNPANNTASTTATIVNPNNGTYSVFAADGHPYTLTIDFDQLNYTMAGNGMSVQKTFTGPNSTGDYVVSGTSRFHVAQDMIVGSHPFSSGQLPYVAARSFVTSVSSIAGGNFDLSTRNVPTTGAPTTNAGTAKVFNNTLSVCQSNTLEVTTLDNCDPASVTNYNNLVPSGNGFTGTSGTGESYSFSIANVGALQVFVSVNGGLPVGGSQQLRIGPVDAPILTYSPPTLYGGSVAPNASADWVSILLTAGSPPVYSVTGTVSANTGSAGLVTLNGGPKSMLTGTSTAYSGKVYVTQSAPLLVVVGGYGGAASGLLQIAVP